MTLGSHLLGRVAPTTTRHLEAHPYEAATPGHVEVRLKIPAAPYNQGQTPECVAFSISKFMDWCNGYRFAAPWLYAECKKIDGMPGDGTNALAACDVLRAQGHWRTINGVRVKTGPDKRHGIASNKWATSVDQIRAVFAAPKPKPVPIGIDWLNAWFKPQENDHFEYVLQTPAKGGGSAGGHEIGIWACSDSRQAFGLGNTWGPPPAWPSLVWLPYKTMDWLFARGADACVIQDLATR